MCWAGGLLLLLFLLNRGCERLEGTPGGTDKGVAIVGGACWGWRLAKTLHVHDAISPKVDVQPAWPSVANTMSNVRHIGCPKTMPTFSRVSPMAGVNVM